MSERASTALKDLEVVYGGPYAHETDAITREINLAKETDRKPDFDALTADWPNISAGALEFLKAEGAPDETPVASDYVFQNVLFDTEEPTNTQPEIVVGDIEMPPPLEGFIPVETFEPAFIAPEEPIFEEPATTGEETSA